jgi:hypothetical protein
MINIDDLLAKDIIPDALIRIGIRSRLKETLKPFENLNCEDRTSSSNEARCRAKGVSIRQSPPMRQTNNTTSCRPIFSRKFWAPI